MSKPILFTKENRAATRNGTKTQTRRVIVDDLPVRARFDGHEDRCNEMWWEEIDLTGNATENYFQWDAPYRVGEVRYVCEPYRIDMVSANNRVFGDYLDDGEPIDVAVTDAEFERFAARKHPYNRTQARFMYRSLARTFVEITNLRREPLQDISEADTAAEGVEVSSEYWYKNFRTLWDSINARRGYGWSTNPTVLVVEYKVVKQ